MVRNQIKKKEEAKILRDFKGSLLQCGHSPLVIHLKYCSTNLLTITISPWLVGDKKYSLVVESLVM